MTIHQGDILVFVGTYTRGESEGIYTYRLDPSSGDLEYLDQVAQVDNPSFLALDPQQRYVYAVNEVGQFRGKTSGAVSAFAIDHGSGRLSFLNQQASEGAGPCHLSVDRTGSYVLVANYGGGSVSMLPIAADGSLEPASDFVQHEGSSADPGRQQGPHAHSITVDPGNRFALAADLGLDEILIYALDLNQGKLRPSHPPFVRVEAGAGPRHFAFHPGGEYAYVINEMGNTMIAYAYNAEQGALTQLQTLSTLPPDFAGTSYCADVHLSPSGRFLYGSNRGHDSLVIYALDPSTGRMELVGYESTRGDNPRNFAIDPTGTFLYAANGESNSIAAFRIDPDTGELEATGHLSEVPAPVCLKMIAADL